MDSFFGMLAVLLFVSGLAIIAARPYLNKNISDKLSSNNKPNDLPSIQTVHATILSKIQAVKELAVLRSNFQSVVSFSEAKKIFGHDIPGSSRKFILEYTGTIVCGCDLSRIRISNQFHNKNHLMITLPNSQVLDMYPDISSFKIHEQSSGIFAEDIKIYDQNREVTKDLEKVKQRLIEEGILLKSNEHVSRILISTVNLIGIETEIHFVESLPSVKYISLPPK